MTRRITKGYLPTIWDSFSLLVVWLKSENRCILTRIPKFYLTVLAASDYLYSPFTDNSSYRIYTIKHLGVGGD